MGYMPSQRERELCIHIGAHKTATTHLQDTLNEIRCQLHEHGICYLHRNKGRSRFSMLDPSRATGVIYRLLSGDIKRKYVEAVLLRGMSLDKKIFLSEENILGTTVDELSAKPYKNMENKLDFITHLAKDFRIRIFFSIRSFDRVLPGAYVTALRFYPKEAIEAKERLLTELENGELPSWVDVIARIKGALPETEFKIWTQEDYRHHSDKIICEILGVELKNIPFIPPPKGTLTPSYKAIAKVEKMIQVFNRIPSNWTSMCDSVYASNSYINDREKYTFLSGELAARLRDRYNEDLAAIENTWPDDLMGSSTC